MAGILDLAQLNLTRLLYELYSAQQCSFFMEDAMKKTMDRYCLSEQQAIELARLLMKEELISTKGFLPSVFLRPQYIHNFPIVLSAKAIKLLRKKQRGQ
ncbi:hypothetical protein SPSYN_01516 [Sporotomaculum syntrophicum]|uniref:Uncharacterized protein n=1 Tax=Sporotomaculum syntrophicum TaxID=182264 RepID=A0A9D2WPV8_9FIRM|nr:hypothetical protein [Sporotomaculum syntrophicum]KAF1085380.1 hypothetical protein SPSYN_01516 [Sporotomaculum syntrophicum]